MTCKHFRHWLGCVWSLTWLWAFWLVCCTWGSGTRPVNGWTMPASCSSACSSLCSQHWCRQSWLVSKSWLLKWSHAIWLQVLVSVLARTWFSVICSCQNKICKSVNLMCWRIIPEQEVSVCFSSHRDGRVCEGTFELLVQCEGLLPGKDNGWHAFPGGCTCCISRKKLGKLV